MENLNNPDPLYDRAKVSNYLSIDETTLDKWIALEKFPTPDLRLGRKPAWKLSTINRHIDKLQQEQQLCR